MSYPKNLVDGRLEHKFDFVRKKKSDHIRFSLLIDGTTIKTKISHGGSKDITDFLQGEMSRQLKVDKEYFQLMMDCPIGKDRYYEDLHLLLNGAIQGRIKTP